MRIIIIGTGNVATVISKALVAAGHTIVQVLGRDGQKAESLARELGSTYSTNENSLDTTAEIYLFALSDSALYELARRFVLKDKIVLHTAGSVSMEVLKGISEQYGVMYPLQSLRKEMQVIPSIPVLVDANRPEVLEKIKSLAASFSSHVATANDEQRLKLHVAAVIVSNFTNHLYALAEDFCKNEKADFKMLLPLIRETAERLTLQSASLLQTGPALRNDFVTLDKHMKILLKYPRLRNLYIKLTDSIMAV